MQTQQQELQQQQGQDGNQDVVNLNVNSLEQQQQGREQGGSKRALSEQGATRELSEMGTSIGND